MNRNMTLTIAAVLAAATFAPSTALAQTTVYSNDFSANAAGFRGGSLTTSPSSNQFLYFGGAGGSATLADLTLPANTSITVAFDLYVVGSMDGYDFGSGIAGGDGAFGGDYFTVTSAVGGVTSTLFNYAFANYGGGEEQTYPVAGSAPGTGATSTNALGYSGFPISSGGSQDAEYHVTQTFTASSASPLSLTFLDHSNEGTSNEFYGIDNLVVSVVPTGIVTAVPEAATWAMMLVGLGVVGGALRRRPSNVQVRLA